MGEIINILKSKNIKSIFLLALLFTVIFTCPPFLFSAESPTDEFLTEETEYQTIQQTPEEKEAQLKGYLKRLYKQSKILYNERKYEEAISSFRELLRLNPGHKLAEKYINLSEKKLSWSQQVQIKEELQAELKAKQEAKQAEVQAAELERKAKKEADLKAKQAKKEELQAELKAKQEAKQAEVQAAELERRAKSAEIEEASQSRIDKYKAERLLAEKVALAELSAPAIIPYRIEKEDSLEITVWKYPELSKEITVLPDGMISFPLVGYIQASGLTIVELKEKITQGLKEFARKKVRTTATGGTEEKIEYIIGLGDKLDISVWREADLSREVIVRPDGMISFPLVGDLKAAGLTLSQLDNVLTKSFGSYLKEPQVSVMINSFGYKEEKSSEDFLLEEPEVSVTIKKFAGRKVIVLGEIARPGVYTFTGDIVSDIIK